MCTNYIFHMTKVVFGLRLAFHAFAFLASFFFFLPTPLTLFMGHEQCIKANEQYFLCEQ